MKKIIFSIFLFCSFSARSTELPMDIAVLRGLDKVTGRISTFSIPVGQVGQFGKTFIVPEACYTHPPEESPENTVFLYVFEKSLKGENIELFKGWMFSSEPALSSMEDPVYDIWLIECQKDNSISKIPDEKKGSASITKKTAEQSINRLSQESIDSPPVSTSSDLTASQVEMEDL